MFAACEVSVFTSLGLILVDLGRSGLIEGTVHCSMLAEDAIKSAISNYYTKNPKAKSTDLGGTASSMPKVEVETVMETPAQQSATA